MSVLASDRSRRTASVTGVLRWAAAGPDRLTALSLRRRVALVAAVYFVLIGVGQVSGLASRMQLDRDLRQQRQALAPAQVGVAALEVSLLDQSSGLRGFAVTGQEPFLEPYEQGRRAEAEALDRLRTLLRDTPDLLERVDRVESAAAAWQREVAAPVVTLVREGRVAEAATIITDKGKLLFDPVRAELAGTADGISALVTAGQLQIERSESRLATRMLAQSGAGLVLFAATIGLLRRWVTEPITALSTSVRRVADGDVHLVIEPSGPPELADLGRDVEGMRRRIRSELDTANRAVEALEQGAPIVVELRAELAMSPESVPPGIAVAGRLQAAEGLLAGDWYDVLPLDGDRAVLLMVDISGHGPVAGLFALRIKHLLVPALRLGMGPGEALGWVAKQLGDTGDRFATCLVVEIGLSTGECRYANAGHPPGLVFRVDAVEELGSTGPLLGPLEGAWATRTTTLGPTDLLAAYTDGVFEVRDADGKELGMDRLVEMLAAHRGDPPETVADDVIAEIRRFGRERLVDDQTLVVLARQPSP